ncbi:hypothetical protein, partial [Sporomusa acidovorans]
MTFLKRPHNRDEDIFLSTFADGGDFFVENDPFSSTISGLSKRAVANPLLKTRFFRAGFAPAKSPSQCLVQRFIQNHGIC